MIANCYHLASALLDNRGPQCYESDMAKEKETQDVSVREIPLDELERIDAAVLVAQESIPKVSRNSVMKLLLTAALDLLEKGELTSYAFNKPKRTRKRKALEHEAT